MPDTNTIGNNKTVNASTNKLIFALFVIVLIIVFGYIFYNFKIKNQINAGNPKNLTQEQKNAILGSVITSQDTKPLDLTTKQEQKIIKSVTPAKSTKSNPDSLTAEQKLQIFGGVK